MSFSRATPRSGLSLRQRETIDVLIEAGSKSKKSYVTPSTMIGSPYYARDLQEENTKGCKECRSVKTSVDFIACTFCGNCKGD